MIGRMNILLVGYGNMGREVERIAEARGHRIVGRVDPAVKDADAADIESAADARAEAAIEFSLAEAVLPNARWYAAHGMHAVVGTTGWTGMEEIERLFATNGGFLWGSNFSVGAHMFSAIVEHAAELCSDLEEYDVLMYEIHHRRKRDSPSGTALRIAERVLSTGKKRRVTTERLDRRREDDELHIGSVRGGEVPGIHTVMFDSEADTVELRHTARNRRGFALGAVLAAEWLSERQGVFTIDECMSDLLGKEGTV